MTIKGDIIAVGVAGAVLLAAGWYAKKKLVGAAETVLPYINPADNANVINQGVEWLGRSVSGDINWTPGIAIYDATHGGALDITSGNNIVNQRVESMYQTVTGSEGSIGTDLYDAVDTVSKWFGGK
jgi:hypothetical protein